MICVDTAFYLWLAALLLLLPLDWVISVILAAGFHEFCHGAVLMMFGGKIRGIRITPLGCVMDAESPGDPASFCSILAGPVGSFALLFLCHSFPKAAVCGLFHGLYNLLPVLPLDGGRGLQLILNRLIPGQAENILSFAGWLVCTLAAAAALWCCRVLSWGITPVILVIFWIIRMHPRKIPCKPWGIGVQ